MSQVLFNNSYNPYPTNIDQFLEKIVNENNLSSIIIVLPTKKLVRYFKQKLIRQYYQIYQKPLSSTKIFNLKSFIDNCYDRIFNDRSKYQISEPYRMLLFEEAINTANLSFYKTKKLSHSLIEKLSNVVYGLKEDGITPDQIEQELLSYNSDEFEFFDEKRIKDILSLYKQYEKLLEDKYLDEISIINRIIKKFKENENTDYIKQIYPEINSIFLFHFTEFKVPEYEFLSYFAHTKISISIVVDYSILNGPIFGNLENTIEHFLSRGFKLTENEDRFKNIKEYDLISNNYDFEKFSLNREIYLRKWLFNHYYELETTQYNDLITIIACRDKQDEVETIAKLVKYYILQKKYLPSDICIVSRKADSYSELFREIFSLYQIPYNVSDRFNLNRSSIIISIISLLNVIIYGFRLDDLIKALNNEFIFIDEIDKDNLFNVAKNLKIIGGRARGGYIYWQYILKAKIDFTKRWLNNIDEINDNYEKKSFENDLKNYEKAYSDLNKIIEILPIIPQNITFENFIKIIENDIIAKFHLKEKIEKSLETLLYNNKNLSLFDKYLLREGIEKNAKALNSFLQLINEICSIHTQRYGNKTYPVETILEKIKLAIEATKYQIKERMNYGVNITSIEQTRGIPYKIMILCGANDGDFPLKYHTDTIVGKELKNSYDKHLKSERLLFYQFLTNNPEALNKGTKQIFITYSQFDSDEYLVRSSFIDALLKITTLNKAGKVLSTNVLEKNENIYKNNLPWFYAYSNINSFISKSNNNSELHLLKNYIGEEHLKLIIKKLENLNIDKKLLEVDFIKQKVEQFLNKPLSISKLELYVKCPFKFLIETFFELKVEELEIDFGISPLTKGKILHKVLKTFYEQQKKEILDNNKYKFRIDPIRNDLDIIVPVELNPDYKNKYLSQLKDIYLNIEELIKNEHPYFKIDSNRILGNDEQRGDLEKWLDSELKRIKNGWLTYPILFELEFGTNSLKPIQSIKIKGNEFRGIIDRIEIYKENNNYYLLITDYKLKYKNNEHKNSKIKELVSFQMPVYIVAAQQILKKYYYIDAEPIGGIYYYFVPQKDDNKFISHKSVLMKKNQLFESLANNKNDLLEENEYEEIIDSVFSKIENIKDCIKNLQFEVSPIDKEICKYCNYWSICKINRREMKKPLF